MKKNIYVILLFLLLFFPVNILALSYGGCEYSEISKLRLYVSNINLSYDYKIVDNIVYFDITLNNMIPGLYFEDSVTGIKYFYHDSNNGEIVIRNHNHLSGSFKFYSALSNCYGTKINNRYYTLPTYNTYYNNPLCDKNRNSTLCQKWSKVNYSYSEFEKLLYEYNNPDILDVEEEKNTVVYKTTPFDKFVSFYTKYYYIILGGIIIVCVTIMIISKKKNSFDL